MNFSQFLEVSKKRYDSFGRKSRCMCRDERMRHNLATFHLNLRRKYGMNEIYLNFWIDNSQLLAAQQLFHWLHKFEL